MTVSTYTDDEFLKIYEERVETHKMVPFKKFFELLGNVQRKNVLDVGCGTGELSKEFIERGAFATGVDKSEKWIELCKNRYGTTPGLVFNVADGVDLSQFETASFDIVTMNMVLINVDTKEDIQKIFKEIGRVLKLDGILLFTDLNPVLKMTPESLNRSQKYLPNFSYFIDGSQFIAQIHLDNGKELEFTNRHWTMGFFTESLEYAGLYVSKIVEPTYSKDAPGILKDYIIPEYIIFMCRKLAR